MLGSSIPGPKLGSLVLRFQRLATFLLLLVATLVGTHSPMAKAEGRGFESTELIVLFHYVGASAVLVNDVLDAVADPQRSPRHSELHVMLGQPKSARHLIGVRRDLANQSDSNSHGLDVGTNEAPEKLLQRYIVLSFESPVAQRLTRLRLQSTPGVLWVGENLGINMAVLPSDPLLYNVQNFPAGAPATHRQWAIDALNLPPAWDYIRGHAYVGIADTGLQTVPNVHPDLAQNFRPQLSYAAGLGYPDGDDKIWLVNDQWGTQVDVRGHGTHVAGIIGATATRPGTPGNPPNTTSGGVAGICWHCNLVVAKMSANLQPTGYPPIPYAAYESYIIDALTWLINSGVQVINVSFETDKLSDGRLQCDLYVVDYHPYCQVLAFAASRDVIVVAAAGNKFAVDEVAFPGRDPRVIPVTAIQSTGDLWSEGYLPQASHGPAMAMRGLAAPGKDVLSTVVEGVNWNAEYRCGDSFPSVAGLPGIGVGYGVCTGTSFAAPHVTGLAALLRSLNPLALGLFIQDYLVRSSNHWPNTDEYVGAGLPNAMLAINKVLAKTNRLTPLFSFYSTGATDYFYTTVPQMGSAAIASTLPVMRPGNGYVPIGIAVRVPDLSEPPLSGTVPVRFPGVYTDALAQAWVFTSHQNPANSAVELSPLYRLSYSCSSYSNHVYRYPCLVNHVDHSYSTDWTEVQSLVNSQGFRFDGIEGYVYPLSLPQPASTETLIRAYHAGRDDHAIFPAGQLASMTAQGYSSDVATLGYVYPNLSMLRPTY